MLQSDPLNDDWQINVLNQLSAADRYLDWQLSYFTPLLGGDVLEIGCGIGLVTQHILARADRVTAVDSSRASLEELTRRLAKVGKTNTTKQPAASTGKSTGNRPAHEGGRLELVMGDLQDDELWQRVTGSYDSVVAINILEHIQDDDRLVGILADRLKIGGRLFILVPACPSLYGTADESAGHYRRYQRDALRSLMTRHSLSVDVLRYFNLPGAIGWWLRFVLRKELDFSSGEISIMNYLTPILRPIENLISPPFGLSLIAVGRKGAISSS